MNHGQDVDARDIRRLRQALGVSNEALARFIGVGAPALCRWQRVSDPPKLPSGLPLTLLNALAVACKRDQVATALAVSMIDSPHGLALLRVLELAFPGES